LLDFTTIPKNLVYALLTYLKPLTPENMKPF
jgi:hypothetical protein